MALVYQTQRIPRCRSSISRARFDLPSDLGGGGSAVGPSSVRSSRSTQSLCSRHLSVAH